MLADQDRFSTFYSVSDALLVLQEQQGRGREQLEQGGVGIWCVCKVETTDTEGVSFQGWGVPGLGKVMALCCQ